MLSPMPFLNESTPEDNSIVLSMTKLYVIENEMVILTSMVLKISNSQKYEVWKDKRNLRIKNIKLIGEKSLISDGTWIEDA